MLSTTILQSHAQSPCHSILWPADAFLHPSPDTVATLTKSANKILHKTIHPIKKLGSAGKTSLNDSQLIATREGLMDADHAAILALAYHLTHQEEFLNQARAILLAWSRINTPTGHPIDETRLEGMIWAYDLISCHLSADENNQIKNWFEQIRLKKHAWKFGSVTDKNNHRIHQLKMLLLLDKILQHHADVENDIASIKKYSQININPETGETLDYQERSALYYHNYVLQPWLTINLISHCCEKPVEKAFHFLSQKIQTGDIHHEFAHSTANIDDTRAKHGFAYAKKESTFDAAKAAPTIILYYTLNSTTPDNTLWKIQEEAKSSSWLDFLRARRELWSQPKELVHTQKHSM